MKGNASMKIIYISWAENCSRSDYTARELGGKSYMVYWGRLGSHPATVGLKYIGQVISTLRILLRERPHAVFVMTPPVFAGLVAYVYGLFARVPYVIDVHTAAILMPRWKHFQWLQRFVCRHAATSLVTNEHLAGIVEAGGGHATIVRDVPVSYPGGETFALNGQFSVAAVCSFNYDEPIEAILQAAEAVPGVRFYLTGNTKYLDPALAKNAPENVTFTGFLSDAAYGSLIANANAVLTLTTRDHTMLRGAWEAIYQGTPVIVSDWPLLREAFDEGTLHVDNTAEGIARAIGELQKNHTQYKAAAARLREKKLQRWQETKTAILARLQRG